MATGPRERNDPAGARTPLVAVFSALSLLPDGRLRRSQAQTP